jgi:hypothetical protein
MLIKLRKRSVQFIEQEERAAYSNISCSMRAPEMEKMWLQLVYRCLSSLNDGGTVFRRTCKARPRRHRLEAKGFRLPFRPLTGLAQNEKRKRAGREAGGRGGMDLFVILAPMEDCT